MSTVGAKAGTWDGGTAGNGTDWGTATNWVGDVLPASTETVSFNTTNPSYGYPTGVTNGSAVVTGINTYGLQVGQVVTGTGITAGTTIVAIGNGTITLSNAFTGTTGNGPISVTNVGGLASSPTISLGASRTIGMLSLSNSNTFTIGSASDISSNYALTLTNVARGVTTAVTIAANVNLVAESTTGKSTWRDSGNGTTTVTGAVGSTGDVILNKGGSTGTVVMNGANTFTGSVVVEAGVLTFGGTNTYTGSTTASGGTMTVNFNAGATATPTTDIINSSSALIFGGVRGGGTLTVNGKNASNAVNSQTFNGTTINVGASGLNIVNGISSGKTLVSLGAITRNVGSTVNFVQPTVNTTISAQNGYTTSTSNDASGILGGYATVAGNDWATNNGTNIVAYTGYTADTWGSNINTNVTADATVTADSTTNSLRFNTAAARTLTLSGVNTLASGGLLVGSTVGNNLTTITGGTLQGASGKDLVVIQNNTSNSLTIASNIQDNTTATALTKSGSGNLNLTGTLSYTGGTIVNGGTLTLVVGSTDPLVNTGAITVTGGTLALGTGTSQTTTGAIILAGGTISGGTLTNNGSALDARNGTISAKLAGSAGINKTTTGTLTLSNTVSNTFTGDTVITEGSVVTTGASTIIAISGNLIVGSASGGNAASFSQSNITFNSAKNVTIYSNGSVNFGGQAQNLTSPSVVTIIGGTLTGTQLYQNVGITMTGGTVSGTLYGTTNNYTTLASTDTATVSAYLNATNNKTWTVADGTAAIDMLFSGTIAATNASTFTKAGAGLLSFTGNSNATGATTVSAGTLSVGNLADGGVSSAVGKSTNVAANLLLNNGTTLQYTGTGHSTDRLFTINGSSAGQGATLDASGTGAVNFTNTGNIAYGTSNQTRTLSLTGSSTADNTLSAVIANNGTGATSVSKSGSGKWILSGTNTYTGATSITGGTLAVNGSLAAGSAVTVSGTGTLGGSGTVAGTVAIQSGGTLAPGNSPGMLNTGTQTWMDGGNYNWQVVDAGGVAGTGFDSVSITGGLNLSSLTGTTNFNINLWSLASTGPDVNGDATNFDNAQNYTWTLVSTTTGVTGFVSSYFTINTGAVNGTNGFTNGLGGGAFSVEVGNSGNDLNLVFTAAAVPEPSTYAAIFGALVLAGAVIHRRRAIRG